MVNPASSVARAFLTPLNASCASERSRGSRTSAPVSVADEVGMAVDEPGNDGVLGEIDDTSAGGNLGGGGLNRLDAVSTDHDHPVAQDLPFVYVNEPAGSNRHDFRCRGLGQGGLAEAREDGRRRKPENRLQHAGHLMLGEWRGPARSRAPPAGGIYHRPESQAN